MPTMLAWTKETVSRAPPKQQDSIVSPKYSILLGLQHLFHQKLCKYMHQRACRHYKDKEVLVKPAIVSAGYNTEIRTFCDAGANTIIIESQVADASTQTESTVSYSDAGTMTNNKDDETVVTLFSIEQTKDDDKMIRFYTGFPSFQLLMICFKFLCAAVSNLSYRDHLKLAKKFI